MLGQAKIYAGSGNTNIVNVTLKANQISSGLMSQSSSVIAVYIVINSHNVSSRSPLIREGYKVVKQALWLFY